MNKRNTLFSLTAAVVSMAVPLSSSAEDDLAAKAQNPIASMISLPIDTSVDFGADNGTAVISNIQPVVPVSLGDWNLVSRAIIPVAYVEGAIGGLPSIPAAPPISSQPAFGLGDINYTGFLSPAKTDWLIWGVGPSLTFPTATDSILGSGKWSAGPSVVMLTQPKPWSLGVLVRQLWSFGGQQSRADVNQTMLQYFINYNLSDGWYLMTDPAMLSNWKASPGNRWTIPVGGGVGRIFSIGKQPVNVRLRAYYNVERPDGAPEWSINFFFAFLFPK